MTATLDRPADQRLWGTMPGWGIIADLTPPELIAARSLRVLRKLLVVALVLVLGLCAAGYVWAMGRSSAASDKASNAAADTTQLLVAADKYSGVTRIESAVNSVRSQVAVAMSTDVDVPLLVLELRQSLPASMSIDNMTVNLLAAGSATTAAGGLDASGQRQIGTVTITGSANSLDGLPAYVDRLTALKGVINVLPTSNQASARTVQFNVTLALTDALYSHRYAATAGGK